MDSIKQNLYENIDLNNIDENNAYNIRENGKLASRNSTKEVKIETKKDNPGIIITVKKNSKDNVVQIPVIITDSGTHDKVYNDFIINENASVTILAGCAIHNDCDNDTSHSGIHTFKIAKNAKVKYIEKHFGCGTYEKKEINTDTIVELSENAELIIETTQIGGIEKANRKTIANLSNNSVLTINEKLLTSNNEKVKTSFDIKLNGYDSKCNVISRSIAKNESKQEFVSNMVGNEKSFGHVECDAILMDNASITSTPKIKANTKNAMLSHEAAIGKIAEDEIIKLMTLGLTEKEAENEIIKGFLN